jgi:hypothetical protein
MKYIAATVTGYALMTRDIEVEIDDAKLEKALEEVVTDAEMQKDFEGWGKPDDEIWVVLDDIAEECGVDEGELADAIVEEWESLPDCVKVRDSSIEYNEDGELPPSYKACREWLLSKGWKYNKDHDIFYRKK